MTEQLLEDSPIEADPRAAAYIRAVDRGRQRLMDEVDDLLPLGLRRLLARGAKLLGRYHVLDTAFKNPISMLDKEDIFDLSMRDARVRQVEMALGRKLIDGIDLGSEERRRDELCARLGSNLLDEFHSDLVLQMNRELEIWKAGDWDGLYLAGLIKREDYLELKEPCADDDPSRED